MDSSERDIDLDPYRVPYYVERYSTVRHKAEHLFDSERRFLPRCLTQGSRVLDVGCACGGFYSILKELEPSIEYVGVDISSVLVERARTLYPEGDFRVVDGTRLPFDADSFDIVQSWGVTLHEPEYVKVLAECWRVTRSTMLFDIRLKTHGEVVVDKARAFVLNPGGVRNYYIVPNARSLISDLLARDPRPGKIEVYAYEGEANRFTTLPVEVGQLYMAGVGLFRGDGTTDLELDVPTELRDAMTVAVDESSHGTHVRLVP